MSVKSEFLRLVSFIALVAANQGCNDDDYFWEEETQASEQPHILSHALTINASRGSSVTFPCVVDGLGNCVLLWKAGTHKVLFALPVKVTRDSRFYITDYTSLHITDILPKDSGKYICTISTNPPMELVHTLNVFYVPETETPVQFVKAKEGTAVELTCVVDGLPEPTVVWKKGEETLFSDQHYELKKAGEHRHILRIHSVSESDVGQYECTAVNSYGTSSTTINVEGNHESLPPNVISTNVREDETPEDTTALTDCPVSSYSSSLHLIGNSLFLLFLWLIIP